VKDRYRNGLHLSCGIPWTDTLDAALRTVGTLAKKQL